MSYIWFSVYYYRLKDYMKILIGNSFIFLFFMVNLLVVVCIYNYFYLYWDLLVIYLVY